MFTGHIHPDTRSALALLETFHSGFKIFTSLLSVKVGDEVQFVLASVFSEGAQWLCSRYWLENYTDTTQYKLCPTSVLFCVLVCSPKPFFHSEKGTKNSLSQQGFLLLAADKIIHHLFFSTDSQSLCSLGSWGDVRVQDSFCSFSKMMSVPFTGKIIKKVSLLRNWCIENMKGDTQMDKV